MIAAGMSYRNRRRVKMAVQGERACLYAVRIITVSMGGPLLVYKPSVSQHILEMVRIKE